MNKSTLVIGASTNPDRYSFKAINSLVKHGHTVFALGTKTGEVAGITIDTEQKQYQNLNTVTLYVGSQNQSAFADYIISLKPQRVIFNPGTENAEFESQLQANGIETTVACTLVLLSTAQF